MFGFQGKILSMYLYFVYFSAVYIEIGQSLTNPCTSNIGITRGDTMENVGQQVLVFDEDFSKVPMCFLCNWTGSGNPFTLWAPTMQTDYDGLMGELRDVRNYLFSIISKLQSRSSAKNLTFDERRHNDEGFYYCSNFNHGCFVGVFQRKNLIPQNFRINHISHTGFEVYWSNVTLSQYVRKYELVVTSEGRVVHTETITPTNVEEYKRKISCVQPGNAFEVSLSALYSFQETGFYRVSEKLTVSTPMNVGMPQCIEAPDVIAQPHPLNKGAVSVTWTLPSGTVPAKSIIRYKNIMTSDSVEKVVDGAFNSAVINNLKVGATYAVSVALSGSGTATHSAMEFSESVFVTTQNVPRSPVLTAPTSVGPHSIELSWKTDAVRSTLPENVTVSAVRYSPRTSFAVRRSPDSRSITIPASSGSVIVSDLLVDTEYLIKIWAANSLGRSDCHELRIRTASPTPAKPKGPSFISAVTLNSSSIHLIWNVSRDDNSSCVPSVFTIITSIIDNEGEVIRIDSTDVRYPLTQVVIDNLLPLKRYRFQIGMTCSNGMDSQTSEIKIRTPSPVPTEEPNVTLLARDCHSVVLDIKSPFANRSEGEVSTYTLKYKRYQIEHVNWTVVVIPAQACADVTQYVLTGLEPDTKYRYKLKSANELGNGPILCGVFKTRSTTD